MNHYNPADEADTERFIVLQLDARDRSSDYRHLRAYVVRAAKAHDVKEGRGTIYHDGNTVAGWRNATWSSAKANAVFVDGLYINGQITIRNLDSSAPPDIERKPYGNDTQFSAGDYLKARECGHMAWTFKVLEKKRSKLLDMGHVFRGDFASEVRALALSLGIKRCIVRRKGYERSSLEQVGDFRYVDLQDIDYTVDHLTASAFAD